MSGTFKTCCLRRPPIIPTSTKCTKHAIKLKRYVYILFFFSSFLYCRRWRRRRRRRALYFLLVFACECVFIYCLETCACHCLLLLLLLILELVKKILTRSCQLVAVYKLTMLRRRRRRRRRRGVNFCQIGQGVDDVVRLR